MPHIATRVLIVENHPMFRDGLTTLVGRQEGLQVVGEAEDHVAAMRILREHPVDLAIIDLSLGRGSGLGLVKSIRAEWPAVRVLVLSMHDERAYAERAFHAGAHGYVMKDQPWPTLRSALRKVIAGQYAYSAQVTKGLLGGQAADGAVGVASLTDRELDVFELLGQGFRIKDIAEHLIISPKTVESHVASIKQKLDIRHAYELVHRATVWMSNGGRG